MFDSVTLDSQLEVTSGERLVAGVFIHGECSDDTFFDRIDDDVFGQRMTIESELFLAICSLYEKGYRIFYVAQNSDFAMVGADMLIDMYESEKYDLTLVLIPDDVTADVGRLSRYIMLRCTASISLQNMKVVVDNVSDCYRS